MKLDREFRDFLIDLFKFQVTQFCIHLSARDFLFDLVPAALVLMAYLYRETLAKTTSVAFDSRIG